MSVTVVPVAGQASRTIGAILQETGLLTHEDVDRVLVLQREHKSLRFGEAAVHLGLVTEADVQFALSRQFEYAYLRSDDGSTVLSDELIAAYEPFSTRVDDLRAIRSHLLLHWFDKNQRRQLLAIVGTESGEGRSYTAANLAIVFAQLGERTLLIDADLRRPRQHELFKLENKLGLSTILAGNSREEAIIRITDLAGLFVLPSGPIPPNPLELFSRKTFEHLLEAVKGSFDVIIIDTPSLARAEDAVMIAARADAAIVMARTGHTRVSAFSDLVKGLIAAGVSVIGSVLNDTQEAKKAKP
jgi:receptor protein-tyrosine kinase